MAGDVAAELAKRTDADLRALVSNDTEWKLTQARWMGAVDERLDTVSKSCTNFLEWRTVQERRCAENHPHDFPIREPSVVMRVLRQPGVQVGGIVSVIVAFVEIMRNIFTASGASKAQTIAEAVTNIMHTAAGGG